MRPRERIISAVKKIPCGKVASYATIARLARTSPRAVGAVMAANRDVAIPCHRVVCADETLGGFNRGVRNKIRLLESEGVRIKNGRIDGRFFI